MEMLNIAGIPNCNHDGMVSFGGLMFSEWVPTWNDEETGFFLNPESIIFGNPLAQLACAGDCAAATFGKPQDELFWCAGCWGSMTPHSGYFDGGTSMATSTSLLVTRALSLQFRMGMEKKTIGDKAVGGRCRGEYFPVLPKTQFKLSLVYPVPEASNTITAVTRPQPEDSTNSETNKEGKKYNMDNLPNSGKNCCHPLGKSALVTGNEHRNIPGKDDYVYMLFRYKDCCVSFK
jgi:conjugal transfer pilus assembly protein TraU